MTKRDFRIGAVLIIAVLLAVVFQLNGLIVIFGVKPAVVLAALVAAAFFIEQPVLYAGLVAFGTYLLRFHPGFSWPVLALALVALLAFWLRGRILWPGATGAIVLSACGVAVFYLLTDFAFIYTAPLIFIGEALYTAVLTALFMGVFNFYQDRFSRP